MCVAAVKSWNHPKYPAMGTDLSKAEYPGVKTIISETVGIRK